MIEFRLGVLGFGSKNVLRKFLVRFYRIVNRLDNISDRAWNERKRMGSARREGGNPTISSLPSIRAINPPVLVPQIMSNTWHGQGIEPGSFGLLTASCRDAWAMSSFKMYKDEMPLTPPPSSERIRNGGKFSVDTDIEKRRDGCRNNDV